MMTETTVGSTAQGSRGMLWVARAVGGLFLLFVLLDTGMHLLRPQPVVDAFARLGLPLTLAVPIGVIELLCTLAYVVPRTRIVGAVLLTAVLGGAIVAHARVGDPAFPTVIFPVIVGLMIWVPLFLTEPRVRSLIAKA